MQAEDRIMKNVFKEEAENISKESHQLSDTELSQVSGGAQKKIWEDGDQILLHLGNGDQKPGEGSKGAGTTGGNSGILNPQEVTLIVVGDGELKG